MAVATSDKQQQQYRAMQPKLTGIRESMNKCARQREFEGKIERKRESARRRWMGESTSSEALYSSLRRVPLHRWGGGWRQRVNMNE